MLNRRKVKKRQYARKTLMYFVLIAGTVYGSTFSLDDSYRIQDDC
jgi:hypothetical protein